MHGDPCEKNSPGNMLAGKVLAKKLAVCVSIRARCEIVIVCGKLFSVIVCGSNVHLEKWTRRLGFDLLTYINGTCCTSPRCPPKGHLHLTLITIFWLRDWVAWAPFLMGSDHLGGPLG